MRPDAEDGHGIIDLWLFNLEPPLPELKRLEHLLCEDELQRAAAFVFEQDRNRYIAGRGRLREILSAYTKRPPAALRFAYNTYGKPALAFGHRPELHFNLSHSAGLALLGVSSSGPIGVDIEQVSPLKENVAAYFFSDAEQRDLSALAENEYLAGFFRCWTRKEAFVKAHGEGLSLPLQSFDVSIGMEAMPVLRRLGLDPSERQDWTLFNIEIEDGFAAAVAALTKGRPAALRWRHLDELHAVNRASSM